MKKVILLILTVMLVSGFLTASGDPPKLLRLTVINKSGNEIYIRLQGYDQSQNNFYYLTIPEGIKTDPKVTSFTVESDYYYRTTWYGPGKNEMCQGMMDTGELIMDRNNRLVFLPCSAIPMRRVSMLDSMFEMFDFDFDFDMGDLGDLGGMSEMMIMPEVNIGEPSMEKVIYSGWQKELKKSYMEAGSYSLLDQFGFNINLDDLPDDLPFDINDFLAVKSPSLNMCQWRYQYKVDKSELESLQIPRCQPNGCE